MIFVCIRGSSSPLFLFSCLSCFSWFDISFAIRVHSCAFVVLTLPSSLSCPSCFSWLNNSCPFVSIRGSSSPLSLSCFSWLNPSFPIRAHSCPFVVLNFPIISCFSWFSWFDIPVRPVLRRALGEPTAANPVEGLTLWGVIRNPCRLALPTLPPFNPPWQFPVPNILVRNSFATHG